MKEKIAILSFDIESDLGSDNEFNGVKSFVECIKFNHLLRDIPKTLFVTVDALMSQHSLIESLDNFELGLHGLNHRLITNMNPYERQKLLTTSLKLFEEVGHKPCGFRATKLAIDNYMMKLLSDYGFLYDSSVLPRYVPFKRYVGWRGNTPMVPYHPNANDYRKAGDLNILELPISVTRIFNMPLSGTWLRYFGNLILKVHALPTDLDYVHIFSHSWDFIPMKKFGYGAGKGYTRILIQIIKKLLSESFEFRTCEEVARTYRDASRAR